MGRSESSTKKGFPVGQISNGELMRVRHEEGADLES